MRKLGFKVFSETGDFDLLLVAGPNCKGFDEGDQVGVQAKLYDNVQVLFQSLPRPFGVSPHFYCALVPLACTEFIRIASKLQVSVVSGVGLKDPRFDLMHRRHWYRQKILKPCYVPDCEVVGMKAGIKAPVQLTQWKMEAIKLCMVGVHRGYLTKEDFDRAKISMGRWLSQGWIKGYDFVKEEGRRIRRYVLIDEARPPHLLFSEITDALGKAGLV